MRMTSPVTCATYNPPMAGHASNGAEVMTNARAEELLRQMLGPDARFRDGQLDAILDTVDRRARTLLVQRTGWGKSLVYFIATKLLREQGLGPTLLISPLLSLMRNQVEAAARIGIRAERIDSQNVDTWSDVRQRLERDEVDVLLVSPERLGNDDFQRITIPAIARGIGLVVVDEAHCISDWGHDFRPDYRRIIRIVKSLPATVPVLGTTATANHRVAGDVREQLGAELRIIRGPLTRDSLQLQTIRLNDQAERMAWLAEHLPRLPGSGIVYCLTTADCDRVAGWLRERGLNVEAYHAQLPPDRNREALEQQLLNNDVKALVASVALGMGFDKPDLGFVVHYQRPGSLIAYYQQIGRAGRSVPQAYAVLLSGREDDEIQEYFIRTAFPAAEALLAVLGAIEAADGEVGRGDLERVVNLGRRKLDQCLKLLEVDGAIARNGSRFFRTANPWQPDVARSDRVTQTRHEELDAIRAFVESPTCLMERVARSLDDEAARPCGRCAVCRGGLLPATVDAAIVRDAIEFLRRAHRVIEPRAMWGSAAVDGRRGRIAKDLQASSGRALAMWGDAGWGERVRQGKYEHDRFGDDLVTACVEMVRSWHPDPPPAWVTAVPSLRRPRLVPDFAERLARALGLPFVQALRKARDTPPQKTMENSAQQMANVVGAFEVVAGAVPPGPVLLVDDMVDSRWTFTECAFALRAAGSGPVHPLALASTAGAGDGS